MRHKLSSIVASPSILVKIIIILLGIIYGILDYYRVVSPALSASLTITVLFLIAEEFIEVQHAVNSRAGTDRIKSKILEFIHRDRGIVGQLCNDTLETLDGAIRVNDDEEGFTLANPLLALSSYVKFWRLLVAHQENRKENNPLTLEIIHSCEIDIWTTHRLTEKLIELQKRFRAAGGTITRIFCGLGAIPHETFVQAYRNMQEADVHALYYDISKNVIDHNFAWDFLHVKETGQAVIWAAFARGDVIEEAIYMNRRFYKGRDLGEMWRDIAIHSVPFPEWSE